ncbi:MULTISPECIES: AMP-binding protein [Bacillus]|uniref:AMP-binding protein n=1 Tax=Bacillus TaxID=1386 RepID=UPI00031F4A4B|nr:MULTISPECIES: AMP-binding protein [Bacillus]
MTSITHTYFNHQCHYPDRVAIKTLFEEITYQDFYKLVCKTANWLLSLQTEQNNIAISLPNGIPFLQLFAGAAKAGWIITPLDQRWTADELEKRLRLCSPSIVISNDNKLQSLHDNVITLNEYEQSIQSYSEHFVESLCENQPFYMGFTSGSTGDPKAFIRSHQSWLSSFQCNIVDIQMNDHEQILIPGSLIHSHFLYGAISTLYLGGTVYLLEKFSPSKVEFIMNKEPITYVYFVPTMIEHLLKNNFIIDKPITVLSSGAKWREASKENLIHHFPTWRLYEFYGASELSFVSLSTQDTKPNSVGKPFHNVTIEIRNEKNENIQPFEIGKIFIKSDMTFIGYIDNETKTIQSIKDENGWSTVHDIGYLDDEGHLYIIGREKNMILYGGINIFPEEIENILLEHPLIEKAVVFALDNHYWGQIVATAIVGEIVDKHELRSYCHKRLASYKIPRKWFFLDEMPLTAGGKIDLPEVKRKVMNNNEEGSHC